MKTAIQTQQLKTMSTKLITIITIALLSLSVSGQQKKSKTYEQSRSAETGRYVTKKEAKANPSTTYTSKKRRN